MVKQTTKTKKVADWCLKGRGQSERNKVVGLIKSFKKLSLSELTLPIRGRRSRSRSKSMFCPLNFVCP